jgi:hypothetical protein
MNIKSEAFQYCNLAAFTVTEQVTMQVTPQVGRGLDDSKRHRAQGTEHRAKSKEYRELGERLGDYVIPTAHDTLHDTAQVTPQDTPQDTPYISMPLENDLKHSAEGMEQRAKRKENEQRSDWEATMRINEWEMTDRATERLRDEKDIVIKKPLRLCAFARDKKNYDENEYNRFNRATKRT